MNLGDVGKVLICFAVASFIIGIFFLSNISQEYVSRIYGALYYYYTLPTELYPNPWEGIPLNLYTALTVLFELPYRIQMVEGLALNFFVVGAILLSIAVIIQIYLRKR